jgi:hypothetical protein
LEKRRVDGANLPKYSCSAFSQACGSQCKIDKKPLKQQRGCLALKLDWLLGAVANDHNKQLVPIDHCSRSITEWTTEKLGTEMYLEALAWETQVEE